MSLITTPTVAPSPLLALCKLAAKIDEGYEDALTVFYIAAARREAERITGLALTRQSKVVSLTVPDSRVLHLHQAPVGPVRAVVTGISAAADPYGYGGADCCGLDSGAPAGVAVAQPFHPKVVDRDVYLPGVQPGATVMLSYRTGPADDAELIQQYPDIVIGITQFVTHAHEHRGDSNMSSWAAHSGALEHWGVRRRVSA